jgi:hypothetical protein
LGFSLGLLRRLLLGRSFATTALLITPAGPAPPAGWLPSALPQARTVPAQSWFVLMPTRLTGRPFAKAFSGIAVTAFRRGHDEPLISHSDVSDSLIHIHVIIDVGSVHRTDYRRVGDIHGSENMPG